MGAAAGRSHTPYLYSPGGTAAAATRRVVRAGLPSLLGSGSRVSGRSRPAYRARGLTAGGDRSWSR